MSSLKNILGIDPSDLVDDVSRLYNSFEIKAKRGNRKSRTILAPSEDLKIVQRAILDKILTPIAPHSAATAFFKGRSIALNARAHVGHAWLYKTDISNFFSSIRSWQVEEMLRKRFTHLSTSAVDELTRLTTFKGFLPQGAPTSPHIANLVLFDFDEQVARVCTYVGAEYTRYADDIAVSSDTEFALDAAEAAITAGLDKLNLTLHSKKTRRFGPSERKKVTGLDVSGDRVRPPRLYRKKATALVRMCEKYPGRMKPHFARVMGYLAYWEGSCAGEHDFELYRLKAVMRRLTKSNQICHFPPAGQAHSTRLTEHMRTKPKHSLDDEIPF